MPDALPAHGERGQSAAAVREGAQAAGKPHDRGPLHDAVQQDRAAPAENDHHGLHRQLQRERADAHAGESQDRGKWISGCFTPRVFVLP